MTGNVRQLRFSDLLFNRRGTFTYRFFLGVFDIALKLFFRRIETVNADRVPEKGGLIFVLNHPNGLIDPALVFVALPRRISFLAKSTLFRMPVISRILRMVEALPVYRRSDAPEDIGKNQETFTAARRLLARGGSIALFPEGVSHNSPGLLPMKTGAARIALGAAGVGRETVNVTIVPVGLFYTNKTTFRSEAMLYFGESFSVEPAEPDADGEPPRAAVKELTERIGTALRDVTLNAETEAELATAQMAEQIFVSAAGDPNLAERFDFLKDYIEERRTPDTLDDDLRTRLRDYDQKLDRRGLEAWHLSLAQLTKGFIFRRAFIQVIPLLLLLPLSIAGTLLHFPAYQLCKILAYYITRHGEDDIASTVKVLAAIIFMPLTWLILAAVTYFYFGWIYAAASMPLSFVCGYAALYSLEEIEILRGWAKAIWFFFTDRDTFLRLFVERRNLQRELLETE